MENQLADEVVVCVKKAQYGVCHLHRQIGMASVPGFRGIEPAPSFLNGGAVLPGPETKTADGFEQRMSEVCELIVDARRNGWEDGASHESIPLQTSKRQGQHPLRNAPKPAAQRIEALWSFAKHSDDQHRPFISDPRKHVADGAAILGHMEVARYQRCAFLSLPSGHLSSLGIKT
jgi:hypothetical protein